MKNGHRVCESADGKLNLKGSHVEENYSEHAKTVVTREDGTRAKLFQEKASLEGKSEAQYAKEFAERAREGSYPGEWVQEESGKWRKK